MEPATRPSPLPVQKTSCLASLGWLLGMVLLVAFVGLLGYQATQLDRDRRAPIVFDVKASGCTLSPGGRFMGVGTTTEQPGDFFDTTNGTKVHVPLPPALFQEGAQPRFWLQGEVFFIYTQWIEDSNGNNHIPRNGWMIDAKNRVVTDVLQLDTALRQTILAKASERAKQEERGDGGTPALSPNGQLVFYGMRIVRPQGPIQVADRHPSWEDDPDHPTPILNEVSIVSGRGGPGCAYGWRPDSGGYYFVDVSRVGLFNIGPGPIRVLLTEPRPYPVPWLMLGELALAGALGYRFWRRRRR